MVKPEYQYVKHYLQNFQHRYNLGGLGCNKSYNIFNHHTTFVFLYRITLKISDDPP